MGNKSKSQPKTQPEAPSKTQTDVKADRLTPWWLPWLSLATTVVLAFIGWAYIHFSDYFELRVDKQIGSKLQQPFDKLDTKIQTTNDKLENLGQRVARIEGKLENLKIQSLAMQPKKSVNAKQASEILIAAKKEGTKLDPELITVAGKEFISAGSNSTDPQVWNAALAFLGYRSFLNAAAAPPTDKFASHDKGPLPWKFTFTSSIKIDDKFRLLTGSKVPAERAAIMEPIGSRENAGEKFGFEFLLIQDFHSDFKLDGSRLKNVIFINSKIVYEGGPVEMENVYFVNCTFEVSRKPNGKNFASAVLASVPSTFRTDG